MGLSKEGFRIIPASAIGGLWSMIAVGLMIKCEDWKNWINLITYSFIAFLMWMVAVGNRHRKKWLKGMLLMWVVTFVLSGISHILWYYSAFGYAWITSGIKSSSLLLAVVIGMGLYPFVLSMIRIRRKYGDGIYKVRLTINHRRIEINGLLDSGNMLTDPYTGRMVHIVRVDLLEQMLHQQEGLAKMHYRLIPFHSVGEPDGILPVIDVECMEILNCNKTIYKDAATIGLYPGILTGTDSYDALLNGALLRN